MPKLKLTEAAILKMKAEDSRIELWDALQQGLHLLVSPYGSRVWYLRYQVPAGRYRRLKLGFFVPNKDDRYGDAFSPLEIEPGHTPLTLPQARSVAGVQRALVSSNRDPAAEKRAKRLAAGKARKQTVEALADDYMEHQKSQGRKTWKQEQQRLDKDVIPVIGARPAGEVSPQEIERILDRIQRRGKKAERSKGGQVQANRTRTLLVSLYNFALLDPDWREVVKGNPAMLTRRPLRREPPRDRKLSDKEIKRLWTATRRIDPIIGAAWRLRILTGQRWTETRSMQWDDLRRERVTFGGEVVEIPLWRIPADRTKNGREHILPLSPQAEQVLNEMRSKIGQGVWVFPSPRKEGEHLGECNKAFARWRKSAKVGAIRHSDIRRTLATGLSRLGFRLEIRQAVLNHSPQDVTRRHYDRYDQIPEMRQALCRWGDEVDRMISDAAEPSKVARIG